MGTRSGCVDLDRRWLKAPVARSGVEGNVLIILLGVVFVLAIMGGAVLELGNAARERALKTRERDRGVGGIEFGLEGVRQKVAHEFEDQAWLDVAGLGSSQDQSSGSTASGYYNISLRMDGAANQIFATQLHNTLQSLVAPDDPFRGAAAVVNTFSLTANAQSLIGPIDQRFNLPALRLSPQISVRQIPVSELTFFSSATSFQVSQVGTIGRIHSEGDLVISGGQITSLYPVTAGGNVSLANSGSLLAQSGPDQPQLSFPVQSTADNNWLAMSRSTSRSTVLSGRDLPMNMVEAAGINQLTAPASSGSANTATAQQELWRQCSRTVFESNGTISIRAVSGASDNAQEKRAFYSYHSPNHPAGSIIAFDVSKAPPASGRNSFYISSSNPNAIVLLINASSLPDDLAIVSPLLIAVEGGFNNQGIRRAGSLVSGNGVIAVPIGWSD
jgi:hypothetical protein